ADYLSSLGDDAIDVILTELDTLFDGEASEKYVDAVIQDWIKEPFIKGSYTYPAPNTYNSETDSRRLDLASNVECKVFFAGEATNNNHPSTVHGALESGARAAAEVLECFSTSIPQNVTLQDNVSILITRSNIIFQILTTSISKAKMHLQTIDGRIVQEFYFDFIPAGENEYIFQHKELPKGVYLACCTLQETLYTKKFILR
ncbi:MAG: FAD-dependent oxidoreductase, partial [Chitinophagales bacterium]